MSTIKPISMMEELEDVGKQLSAILDRYLNSCAKMDDLSSREGVLRNVSQTYLDRIGAEITRFSAYQQALGQAAATIRRVRNRLSRLTPISSLPPEILTHIFHLVANPCDLLVPDSEDSETSETSSSSEDADADSIDLKRPCSKTLQLENFPTHLDRLTYVCSYWRRIAINSPSLWTHIDLFPHKALHRGFLAHAGMYATRSGGLPLELHMVDDKPLAYNGDLLVQFLSSIRDRVKSLDIAVTHGWRHYHYLVLDAIFSLPVSKPATVTKLTTSFPMKDDVYDEFIDWLDDINSNFDRLTILHLRGLYPRWESTAYHNLVDLRLIASCDEHWTYIPESKLLGILAASPGLRILHFSLQITRQKRDDASIIPARLNDLQVVSISTDRGGLDELLRPGHVLRLLAPGSKPLCLSIWHSYYALDQEGGSISADNFSVNELVKFFQRSNITKFRIKGLYSQLHQLICHAPNLEDLLFDSCPLVGGATGLSPGGLPIAPRLNSLILYNCYVQRPQLRVMLQVYPANLLVISSCNLFEFENHISGDSVTQLSTFLEEYPSTKLVVNPLFDPVADWDLMS